MNTLYNGEDPYSDRKCVALLAVALLVVALSVSGFGQSVATTLTKDQLRVMKVDQEIRKAIVHADVEALDRLLVNEWTVTHTNGKQQTKAQFLEAFRSGRVRFERMDLDDIKVQVFGSMAVLTARITDKVVFKGEPAEGQVRVMSIYIKRDHRWQNLTEQATHIDQ